MNSVKHGFEKQQTFIFSAELFKTFEDIVKTAWTCDKKSLKFEIFSYIKKSNSRILRRTTERHKSVCKAYLGKLTKTFHRLL